MGRIYEKLKGRLDVEVCGAYVEGLLNAAALSAIALWDIQCVDDCTVRLRMYETDYPALKALSEKCMCDLKPIRLSGGSRDRKLIKRRVWLLLFLLLMGLLLLVAVLFIVAFMQEKMGNFTINLNRLELYRRGIAIADDNLAAGALVHNDILQLVQLAIQANTLSIESQIGH